MKKIFLSALVALTPLTAEVIVIKNATIMTESSKGTIKGSILVRDGKIASVSVVFDARPFAPLFEGREGH